MILIGQGYQKALACNGYATKYKVLITLISLNTIFSSTFAHLNIGWSNTKGATFQVVEHI